MTAASLFVIRGNDQGARFDLIEDRVSLGREGSNSIQLRDHEVSRHHAELVLREGRYWLVDLGSSNGTFVNSETVQKHELATGDQVQLGRTLLLFTAPDDASRLLVKQKVDIVAQPSDSEQSRIVRRLPQSEGSRILKLLPQGESSGPSPDPRDFQFLYRTALAVSQTLEIDQLLSRMLELIFEWVQPDHGCVMLIDPDGGKLERKSYQAREGLPAGEKLVISQTILDYVVQHNEGVLTTNAQEDSRWGTAGSILQAGIREAMCVPMQGRYDVVGVIYIDTTTTPQHIVRFGSASRFSDEHLKLMIAIAHQAALAVEDTRYYTAMVQAERLAAIGQTIAMLSHHIKNVLQGIRGGSFLIKDGLARHDEQMVQKGWEFVEKNQQRISDLVMDMLTFSKEREPEIVPAELNLVLGEVIELMEARAKDLGASLVWKPDLAMPRLMFDPEAIHRAVLNIVTNAIDAVHDREDDAQADSPGGDISTGVVEVGSEYRPQDGLVRITVADNGPGIAADKLEKIFTFFVSDKRSRGTGLGLPVAKKIIEEHGGRIDVESQLGRGTRFIIYLPARIPDDSGKRETKALDLPS